MSRIGAPTTIPSSVTAVAGVPTGAGDAVECDRGLRIEDVRVRDLERVAREADRSAPERNLVPITPHRAQAHAANPYADPDDLVLFVAYEGNECVGYIGALPGRLRVDGRLTKMYWGSAYYVRPDQRDTGVAMQLMARLLEQPYDLVLSAPSRVGERVYRGLGFIDVGPLEYLVLRRNDPQPGKSLPGRVFRRVARLLRGGANPRQSAEPWDRFGASPMTLAIDSWRFRPISDVPRGLPAAGATADAAFHRGPEVVRWMLAHPWIVEARAHQPCGYYFSDVRDVFRHVLLGVYRSGEDVCRGFVAFSLSATGSSATLKVLDAALPTDGPYACVARLAFACAERFGVRRVELSECYRDAGEVFGDACTAERKQRLYFCRPHRPEAPLARVLDRLRLDYCDGENPFL
jgi:GNAT superfamily N-acetyltransferase